MALKEKLRMVTKFLGTPGLRFDCGFPVPDALGPFLTLNLSPALEGKKGCFLLGKNICECFHGDMKR